jgi:hypothetical protein
LRLSLCALTFAISSSKAACSLDTRSCREKYVVQHRH